MSESVADRRWSPERATEWYERLPWIVGANFFPSTAINSIELWNGATFDPDTISRELGWARELGMNSIRVFVNYVAWQDDRRGVGDRFDTLLDIASSQGIRTVPVLLDDCRLSDVDPVPGPQPDPVPGVFTSAWVPSLPPGGSAPPSETWDSTVRPYVTDMVARFGRDDRVLFWDLYNEPGEASMPLIEASFSWARDQDPSQPIASCFAAEPLSDLMNLHNYWPLTGRLGSLRIRVTVPEGVDGVPATEWPSVVDAIADARRTGRPVIVTEWLARHLGSRVETHLPYFHRERIAVWNWGLVNGKMNTHLTWAESSVIPVEDGDRAQLTVPEGAPEGLWFHDLLHADGTPCSALEAETFRYYTSASRDIWTR